MSDKAEEDNKTKPKSDDDDPEDGHNSEMEDDKEPTLKPEGQDPEELNDEEEQKEDGIRQRKLTMKGKEYQAEVYTKGFWFAMTSWRTAMCMAAKGLVEWDDKQALKQLCTDLSARLNEVATAYDKVTSVLDSDEYYQTFERVQIETQQTLDRISRKTEDIIRDDRSMRSAASSNRSRASAKSNRSGSSSTRSSKANVAAEAAALRASLEFVEAEAKQKAELEKIQLKKQLSMAEARYNVIVKEEVEEDTKGYDTTPQPKLNPAAPSFIPASSGRDSHRNRGPNQISDLALALAEQVHLSRLSAPEPGTFSGEPLKYPAWRTAFDILVNNKALANSEKLHHLKRYLAGEARDTVEGFFVNISDGAYIDAMNFLHHRYGDPYLISNAYRDKLESWPKIAPRDGKGLRMLADFLMQCKTAMMTIPTLGILNDERENRKLLTQLPDWVVLRWGRVVARSKVEKFIFPSFADFVTFMQVESEIANDSVYMTVDY